jgi:hypothetical protein
LRPWSQLKTHNYLCINPLSIWNAVQLCNYSFALPDSPRLGVPAPNCFTSSQHLEASRQVASLDAFTCFCIRRKGKLTLSRSILQACQLSSLEDDFKALTLRHAVVPTDSCSGSSLTFFLAVCVQILKIHLPLVIALLRPPNSFTPQPICTITQTYYSY